jgi:putative nucleotidyltransferase with HDIG domain
MPKEIAQKFLNELIDDLKNDRLVLPTLPEVALRVRDAVNDEESSLKDIARIVASDAALSARIIQVANSPLMRASKAIENLDMAVNRLGTGLIRDMVTSMVMQQMFQATSDLTDKKLRQIWEHSTEVASISHALAAAFTKLSPEQAMLAGLVHDIGTLPILTKAEDYPELLAHEALLDAIIKKLHPKIGEAILKAWNFPPELVKVASEHENIARNSEQTDFVDVVIVANLQANAGEESEGNWDNVPAFGKLGLASDINVIEMEETAEDIQATQQLLSS